MSRIVVVGGGWAGCAAAAAAKKKGMDVVLLERTDMLLGTGLVGGIMRNNGRFTAAEEMIAIGAGELFELIDGCCKYENIDFPGHKNASLYDISMAQRRIKLFLKEKGIKVFMETRVDEAFKDGPFLKKVYAGKNKVFEGDFFIDATGTAGPQKNCAKYGNGCVMCIMRCRTFGGRTGLADLCGTSLYSAENGKGFKGAMSGSCKLMKDSLSRQLINNLELYGVAVVPLADDSIGDLTSIKACQQYASQEYKENIVLLNTGHAKMMIPFLKLEKLQEIPGLENSRYEDPYSGGRGNSIRLAGMVPCDEYMRAENVYNLFCCGEKAGPMVGHTEALVTGTIAGWNAALKADGKECVKLPEDLAVGDYIKYSLNKTEKKEGIINKMTFSGSVYFDRMKEKSLYNINIQQIREKVSRLGMENFFRA